MIQLTCSQCGSKFRVKDEFAGRVGRCPTCKQPMTVSRARAADATVPTGKIDGTPSSLRQSGLDVNITLDLPSGSRSQQRSVADLLAGHARHGGRYTIEGEIARGGMGAVVRAVDCDIRREVAVKYMLDDTNEGQKARFVEEAQITGQLEHPNIVPIHELGIDAEQRLFFAMKMVRGRSLGQILQELREHPETAEKAWSLSRQLNVFVNVCHALAYAHSRGVIHRDLKPANIMVGDFGEVYVMDWGVAKIMGARETKPQPAAETQPAPAATSDTASDDSGSGTHSGSTRVLTSREVDCDLTQDGAIMGTPAYMSPEQANGKSHKLDAQSDIYSLGAILYELLTLHSPILKDGGHLAVLMRVATGQIQPLEKRAPERARQGKIPKELAAVAMKSLALKPENRYPTVESLRRDIERFQEGRSVSAKDDTPWEALVKFTKRNKGFSAATGTALLVLSVVLAVAFQINNAARVRAEGAQRAAETSEQAAVKSQQQANQSYADYLREQLQKQAAIKKSLPAFLRATHAAIKEHSVDDALVQADLALDAEPANAEAHFLKGQLLIARQRYPEARQHLAEYLQQKPDDAAARQLFAICEQAQPGNDGTLLAFADAFTQQKAHQLADAMIESLGESPLAARNKLLKLYRQRLVAAWPDLHPDDLSLDTEGQYHLGIFNVKPIENLEPLRGIPLTRLEIGNKESIKIRDLEPLRGMKLQTLRLDNCPELGSLEPLRNMPLKEFRLFYSPVRDLDALRGLRLVRFVVGECANLQSLDPLREMPLESLSLEGCRGIIDIELLRGLPLKRLILRVTNIKDLEPLRDMKLNVLDLDFTQVSNLEPLRGMPLTILGLGSCGKVRDFTPLKDLPLIELNLGYVEFNDITILQRMPLKTLDLTGCAISDLTPLRGMPLKSLKLNGCQLIDDLTPLRELPLSALEIMNCRQLKNLAPLRGLRLENLGFWPKTTTEGIDAIREMRTLKYIGPAPGLSLPAAEFWQRYDAGEFKK